MLCAVGSGEGRSDNARGSIGRAVVWVRDPSLKQLAAWLGALALALTAPFGGWADASHPPMTVVTADQVVKTGPIDVTITRIRANTRPGETFAAMEDGQYLLVFGTARGTAKTTLTNGELADAIRLDGVPGLEKTFYTNDYLPVTKSMSARPRGVKKVVKTMRMVVRVVRMVVKKVVNRVVRRHSGRSGRRTWCRSLTATAIGG